MRDLPDQMAHLAGDGSDWSPSVRISALSRPADLLLRLCAAPDSDLASHFAALDADEWRDLVDQAIAKRVALLLDRSLSRADGASTMPPECREAIEDERRRLTMSAFGHMIALTEAVTFLESHGISPVALKGARLAFRDYPEPRLRPLRDLDLLVPAEQAERAQQLMIDSGTYEVASWAEFYGMDFNHQLPELLDSRRGISFEIHHRLNARDWGGEPALVRMVLDQSDEIVLSGKTVRVPSMHANFLHLVEHATVHHMFDNGPITLADLHFAAQSGKIDWPLLLAQARQLRLDRALHLVAALALSYGATWVPHALSEPAPGMSAHLGASVAAMLRDENLSSQAAMLRDLTMRKGRGPGWSVALRAAVTPNPVKLASIMRVKSDSPARWLAYPVWLFQRGKAYLAPRHAEIDGDRTEREVAVLRWLRDT